jgi:hypothetical protein
VANGHTSVCTVLHANYSCCFSNYCGQRIQVQIKTVIFHLTSQITKKKIVLVLNVGACVQCLTDSHHVYTVLCILYCVYCTVHTFTAELIVTSAAY